MDFNLAQVHEAVEEVAAERPCIIAGDRILTYSDVGRRTRRLANALRSRGLGAHAERRELSGERSGQDHLALYLHNCPEYLEGMLGSYKARVAPFNVNYRYVAEELEYLLRDAGTRAVIVHSCFAEVLDAVRRRIDGLEVIWQVDDGSGAPLIEGAEWYEDVLAASDDELPAELVASWSPDDLYVLYTGGTTGMPKGVLWRQADIFVASMGGRQLGSNEEWPSLEAIAEAAASGGAKLMPCPPFMHGAAHWLAFNAFTSGNTVVLADDPERFDPEAVLRTIDSRGVNVVLIVGDAFGRPLVEAIERGDHNLSSVLLLVSGGAPLTAGIKARFLAAVPTLMVMDGLGSSETGTQASQTTAAGQDASTGTFTPGPGACVLDADLTRVVPVEEAAAAGTAIGWLAQTGRVPLGYLGDAAKTAATFPVIDGVRYAVPGDRAMYDSDGRLVLLGRDSVTINSGGEKIFAEEVEAALATHPAVADVVVCGRPSETWGSEVVAVVQLAAGSVATPEELNTAASAHLARYKLPKAYTFVERVERSPSGKADYRWARERAGGTG